MADTCFEKFTRCAKVCGLFFLDCAFRMLIGWADKLWSRGWLHLDVLHFELVRPVRLKKCISKIGLNKIYSAHLKRPVFGKLPVPILVSTSRPLFTPEKRLGYWVAWWLVISKYGKTWAYLYPVRRNRGIRDFKKHWFRRTDTGRMPCFLIRYLVNIW